MVSYESVNDTASNVRRGCSSEGSGDQPELRHCLPHRPPLTLASPAPHIHSVRLRPEALLQERAAGTRAQDGLGRTWPSVSDELPIANAPIQLPGVPCRWASRSARLVDSSLGDMSQLRRLSLRARERWRVDASDLCGCCGPGPDHLNYLVAGAGWLAQQAVAWLAAAGTCPRGRASRPLLIFGFGAPEHQRVARESVKPAQDSWLNLGGADDGVRPQPAGDRLPGDAEPDGALFVLYGATDGGACGRVLIISTG